jgi:hypothetical protein
VSKFIGSHTSFTCFETCPKQFYHRYIAKDAVFEDSPASRWGNLVHGAMEARLKRNEPLPEEMKKYEVYAAALGGKPLLIEEPLGVDLFRRPEKFWGEDVWFRGKPDVVVLDGRNPTAVIFDWKTGKRREDPAELETFAVLVNARYPLIEDFVGYYVWLASGEIGTKHKLDWRKRWHQITGLDALIRCALRNLSKSTDQTSPGSSITAVQALDIPATQSLLTAANAFPPRPNGLCKAWCNVMNCPHNGKR